MIASSTRDSNVGHDPARQPSSLGMSHLGMTDQGVTVRGPRFAISESALNTFGGTMRTTLLLLGGVAAVAGCAGGPEIRTTVQPGADLQGLHPFYVPPPPPPPPHPPPPPANHP